MLPVRSCRAMDDCGRIKTPSLKGGERRQCYVRTAAVGYVLKYTHGSRTYKNAASAMCSRENS